MRANINIINQYIITNIIINQADSKLLSHYTGIIMQNLRKSSQMFDKYLIKCITSTMVEGFKRGLTRLAVLSTLVAGSV